MPPERSPIPIPPRPTTRFAPSPTGLLHLGHVANAVWTWGAADAANGRVVLRMEDHDRGRCRPEYERAILEDLGWLGLRPEQASGGSFGGGPSPWRQTDNDARYREALDRLSRVATVYACRCSRKTVALAGGDDAAPGAERRYPGTCRDLGLEPGPGRGLRVALPEATVRFDDLRLGRIEQRPARQCGDLLVRDQVGNWTYQFSVVVDDLAHGIDLVVRGEDILSSTGRQIMLAGWLGQSEPEGPSGIGSGIAGGPAWLHHPLILDSRGIKLSKRDGARAIAELREEGWDPADVLGLAARLTGLDVPGPITADRLGELFRPR